MTPQPDAWRVASWARPDGDDPPPPGIPPSTRAALAAEVAALDDDQQVTVRAGVLRALLDLADPPRTFVRGAAVTDVDRRVTYRATLAAPTGGRARLRTVEVVPHDDEPDPRVFRVPVAAVAAQTAYVLAQQRDTADETGGDPADVLVWGEPDLDGPPSPETLAALVSRGLTRARIAERYGRSVGRVDQWLREARNERPDLPWPAPRRGPQPRQADGTPAPGTREAGWARVRAQAVSQQEQTTPTATPAEGNREGKNE